MGSEKKIEKRVDDKRKERARRKERERRRRRKREREREKEKRVENSKIPAKSSSEIKRPAGKGNLEIKDPVKKVINKSDNNISSSNNSISGISVNYGAHVIGGISNSRTLAWDKNGNIAILDSSAKTVTSDFEVSAGISGMKSNAKNIDELTGKSLEIGVGADTPLVSVGINYNASISQNGGEVVNHSVGPSFGVGLSPAEIETGLSDTKLKAKINLDSLKGEYHGSLFGQDYKVEIDLKKGDLKIGKE
ncbi:MAG: hypothetical protein N4A40_04040 [Tissierellales bacterium]|jgi:hypothetical protein|nr:hypothetical protein [Tissierellales bacterium]